MPAYPRPCRDLERNRSRSRSRSKRMLPQIRQVLDLGRRKWYATDLAVRSAKPRLRARTQAAGDGHDKGHPKQGQAIPVRRSLPRTWNVGCASCAKKARGRNDLTILQPRSGNNYPSRAGAARFRAPISQPPGLPTQWSLRRSPTWMHVSAHEGSPRASLKGPGSLDHHPSSSGLAFAAQPNHS